MRHELCPDDNKLQNQSCVDIAEPVASHQIDVDKCKGRKEKIHCPGTGVCNFLFSRDPRYVDEVDDGCFGARSRAGALAAIRGLRNGSSHGGVNVEQHAGATPSGDGFHQVRSGRVSGIKSEMTTGPKCTKVMSQDQDMTHSLRWPFPFKNSLYYA